MKRLMVLLIMLLPFLGGCGRYQISTYSEIVNCKVDEIGITESFSDKDQQLFKDFYKLIQGTWLNEVYIKNIKNKEYLFSNVQLPSSIDIFYDEDQQHYCWSAFTGEEGKTGYFDSIKIEHQPQKVVLTLNDNDGNIKLVIDKKGIVKFLYGDIVFEKIDCSEDTYINRNILVGEYKDQNGKSYAFTEDEVANWPDRSFKYNFTLSYFCSKNTIAFKNEEGNQNLNEYAFDIINGKVYFYETIGGGITSEVSDKPFLVLEKIN